jgi:hypothetical protein
VTQRLLHRSAIPRFLKLFLLISLFLTSIGSAVAQEAETPKATLITRFPFTTLYGGIIIIQARLENFPDTLNFILDTGSGGISLDSSIVDYLKLVRTPSERMLRGIGSIRKISYVVNKTLHLPNLDIDHLDFHINDYELLTSVYGVRIDGIMGYSFLSRYIVKVDYDKNILEVWSQGTLRYPKSGITLKPSISGIPVFDAVVSDSNTINSRFYFDSGAGLCLLMTEDFEKDSSLLSKRKKMIVTVAEGIGGKTTMRLTTIREMKIGKYKFKRVPAHIFHDEYNVISYPLLGGLIGNDLLRRFNLIINYPEKEIHLRPNTHFKDPFDYSYTGIGMYLEEGRVVIEDVLQGSPAEKAGLKPGDIVFGINNNVSGNIQAYKNILQDIGEKVRMVILRKGELLVFYLKVKSFLDKN